MKNGLGRFLTMSARWSTLQAIRSAQPCVAKTAGFEGARVDRGLLDGRVGIQQVWEVVRPAARKGCGEAGVSARRTVLARCRPWCSSQPHDDEGAAGSEHVANVVKNNAGIRDVVERKAGDHGIQRSIWHVVLEGDPSIARPLRRLGIDTEGVVADAKKGPRRARQIPRNLARQFLAGGLGSCSRTNGQVA
jgi:hypothetical protein